MTTVTGTLLLGGGATPLQARKEARVEVAGVAPVFLTGGQYLLPPSQSVEVDPATGAWSVTVEALPEGYAYRFSAVVGGGSYVSTRTVTVPASGTVAYKDLPDVVVIGVPTVLSPSWATGVLAAAAGIEGDVANAEEAATTATTAATTATTAAASIAADREYVEELVVTDLGTTDGQSAALVASPTSATRTALNATTMAKAAGAVALTLNGLPRVNLSPPTVVVDNNQGIDASPLASTRLTAAAASGWYTSLAPTDVASRRYFAPSAPRNPAGDAYPDTWSTEFSIGTAGRAAFVDEHRLTGGQKIQYMLKQQAGATFRLMVNGQYLTAAAVPVGGTPGGFAFITIDFGATLTAPVDIRFEGIGFRYYGPRVAAGQLLSKVPGPDPKVILFAGDSYWAGAGLVTNLSTMARQTAWLLGYRAVINASVGGSGYIAPGNQGEPALKDRVAAIVAAAPDVAVIGMGHNDTGSSNAAVAAAASSTVAGIRAGLPNAKIVVTGPMFSTPTPGVYAAMQAAVFTAVSATSGVITIDTTTVPWIVDAEVAAAYLSSDGTHFIQVGHDYSAVRLAERLKLALADRF